MKIVAAVLACLAVAAPLGAQGHGGSCTCGGYAAVPVVWEVEHRDQPDFAAAAFSSFERWNRYLDAFAPRNGDGTMEPNGTSEIGFLTLEQTSKKYGINIDRNVFAITFMSPLSAAGDFDACPKPPTAICGTFAETDVIMNADFFRGFRASGEPDFDDVGPALYDATAVHELGHALGFHHNVSNISVMNLYEDFAARYVSAADTAEARRAYPTGRRVTDLAVYPFFFDPERTDYAATTPVRVSAVASARGAITIQNFGFENVGSETVSDAEIRFYLSSDRNITAADTLLGFLTFSGPITPGAYWDDAQSGRSFQVPESLPAGVYFLGAIVTLGDGSVDEISYNDSWTAPGTVRITTTARRRASRH